MNIFVLHEDPVIAAQMHCNKHVVKMILESAQMLCTTLHHYGLPAPYKPTHKNHPCTVWARQSRDNFVWLWKLMRELNREFVFRYNKNEYHKSYAKMELARIGLKLTGEWPTRGLTKFAQAMPEQYRKEDTVQAYRDYYLGEKSKILQYTKRSAPDWILGR